jgi:hypothetical protein
MSSLSAKDRVSLCSFSFADGRRCRTPRAAKNPHFCFYHAQKEARASAAETLGKDLAYFFSGNYLSACDLSTALGRLIPAVVRGDVKPKTAHTVAYLMQTLLQAIHVSQHEYCEALGPNAWRNSVYNSVKGNHDYRFPPAPKPKQPVPHPTSATVGPINVAAGRNLSRPGREPGSLPATSHIGPDQPQTQPPQSEIPALSGPAPSPHTPLPPTSAEFAQRVLAGQDSSSSPRASQRSSREPGAATANPASQPAETSLNCHSDPTPATQPAASVAPTPQPACPVYPEPRREQGQRVNPREPDRSAP